MKKVQYIEMNDNEHGLIGLGNISYNYTYDNNRHLLIIRLHSVDKDIEYVGNKAKNVYYKMINDTHKETINLVTRLACDAVGIPLIRIKEKSRKQEVVWARNMIFWYVNKYLHYSLALAGQLFDKDHATVIHGIREFNKPDKYQKENRKIWSKIFIDKCITYRLFTKQ